MKLKYWVIVVLAIAVVVSVFFNIKIILANETEQEKIVADAYSVQFTAISRELNKLNFTPTNNNFLANIVMSARLEKSFETKEVDRIGTTKEVVGKLLNEGVVSLPESFRIELFLDRFVKYVPDSEFLTQAEYDEKYGYDPEKTTVIADIGGEFDNAIYFKFPDFITDETDFSFRIGMEGIMGTSGMPNKIILDLRGCSRGQTELGASLAECLYKINYLPLKQTRDKLYFTMPAELLFYRIRRPFEVSSEYKWQDTYFHTVNPIFKRTIDNMDPGIYFDRDIISLKRNREEDFKSWIANFNSFINGLEIFILVDNETAGLAELFTALLKNKFADNFHILTIPNK